MSKDDTHAIRNGTIAAVLAGLILMAVPYTRRILGTVVSATWGFVSGLAVDIWNYLWSTAKLPWLAVWFLIALSIPTIWRLCRRWLPRGNREPRVTDYTADHFFGVDWKWSYAWGDTPSGISPFCPRCKTRLVIVDDWVAEKTILRCETCRTDLSTLDGKPHFAIDGTIGRQIERRINAGEWKHHIKRDAEPEN